MKGVIGMIDQLYEWVKNIVIYMIVNTIIMNLLGDTSYKKYVSMVSGMVLVLLVISPFLDLLSIDKKFDLLFQSNNFVVETAEFKNNLQRMEEDQRNTIFDEYANKIENQTKEMLLDEKINIKEFDVEFQNDNNKEQFGEILKINIKGEYISEDTPAFDNNIGRIQIDRIVIDPVKDDSTEKLPSPIEINIKNKLSDFYNIKKDNINISIQGG